MKISEPTEPASGPAEPLDPGATAQSLDNSPVVILGHPTSTRQKGILPDVNDLTAKLRGVGVSYRAWKDQWADEDQPAAGDKDLFQRGAVFIQPAAPADAVLWSNVPETMTDWLSGVATKAGADGVPKSRAVLWVPARHKSDKSETFDARVLARTEADNPIFNRDTPEELAGWIKQQIGGRQGPVPVVAIEEMEAGDLREALQSGCEKVVFDIVKPPSEPWPFYNEESLEDQLRQIEGERAIIAVHDLNTGRASNKMEAQNAVEGKIKEHMKRANEITKALNRKLDLFWTVLLVDKVKLLPMIRYPNNKLPDVTFLPFRKTLGASVPAPDPQGAKIYQSYLKDWVAAPKSG